MRCDDFASCPIRWLFLVCGHSPDETNGRQQSHHAIPPMKQINTNRKKCSISKSIGLCLKASFLKSKLLRLANAFGGRKNDQKCKTGNRQDAHISKVWNAVHPISAIYFIGGSFNFQTGGAASAPHSRCPASASSRSSQVLLLWVLLLGVLLFIVVVVVVVVAVAVAVAVAVIVWLLLVVLSLLFSIYIYIYTTVTYYLSLYVCIYIHIYIYIYI